MTAPQMAPSINATHLNGLIALMIFCCSILLNLCSHCACKSLFKWALNSLISVGKSRANSSMKTSFNSSIVFSPINIEIMGSLELSLCLKKSSNFSLIKGFRLSKGSFFVNWGMISVKLIWPIHWFLK